MPLFAQDPREIDQRASDWMHRGMDWMAQGAQGAQEKAIACFNRAIALRRKLPLAENPRHRYGLAAGWMNRADALSRLGTQARRVEAIASYDEALALLRSLPLEDDALYPRRLAIALINQSLVRQKSGAREEIEEAILGCREALAVLENPAALCVTDRRVLRAAALGNLGDALLERGDSSAAEAQVLARESLALVREVELEDRKAAEAGGNARHVLCCAIAAQSRDGQTVPAELLALATATVDDGLALARHWEQRGDAGFRALAQDLFRFGCRVHQGGEPGFLVKFILESLDPVRARGALPLNTDNFAAALGALWMALRQIQQDGFQSLSGIRLESVLQSLRHLRVTEDRLKDLRRAVAA
jgi:tetratricopeptide (TPR) repeat protein